MEHFSFAPTPLYLWKTDERGNRWYLKREDLLPYSFGGNKARIGLEYLRDMRARSGNHLVAYGNARSNLCRVLGNLCAGQGLPLTIISPADDDGDRRLSFNEDLCAAFGARIVPCQKSNVAETVDRVLAEVLASGERPYYIYGDRLGQGNADVPVRAYAPLWSQWMAQCAQMGFAPDLVSLAVGTGMTLAGLLCGRLLAGGGPPALGLSIARDAGSVQAHTVRYGNAWLARQDRPERLSPSDVAVCDAYRQAYGVYDETVAAYIRQAMAQYGLPLDGTYVGKALCGLERLVREKGWQNRQILFIHTGGTPLFFDALAARRA